MSTTESRHTCQICKRKRYSRFMFKINNKSLSNGKPEWVCSNITTPGAKDNCK